MLQNLIEISDEKLKQRKKVVNQACEAYPIMGHKTTMTEKKYLLEGDREIAKRSENMLSLDSFFETEFTKTLEIFDLFVSQPGEIES